MSSIWCDYKEDLIEKEYLDAEEIFIAVFSETYKHTTPNAKLFTDLYNWYTCGIEDGICRLFTVIRLIRMPLMKSHNQLMNIFRKMKNHYCME